MDIRAVSASEQNDVLKRVAKRGPGTYMRLLSRQLKAHGIEIPFYEFDLYDEMDGRANRALLSAEELLAPMAVVTNGGHA